MFYYLCYLTLINILSCPKAFTSTPLKNHKLIYHSDTGEQERLLQHWSLDSNTGLKEGPTLVKEASSAPRAQ